MILLQTFQFIEILAIFSIFFPAIFSAVTLPVRAWLHMRFLLCTSKATIASPLQAKIARPIWDKDDTQ